MANFQAFHLADQQVNARGAKFCSLTAEGERVYLTLGSKQSPLYTQWGPSSFDQSSGGRCNFDFVCDEELGKNLKALDEWTKDYIEKHSQRIFGKALTKDQIADGYRPALVQRGSYPPSIRCKVNMTGQRQVKCWTQDGAPRDAPEDWKACTYVVRVNLSHLWLMSREFGWVFNVEHVQVFENSKVCPFV